MMRSYLDYNSSAPMLKEAQIATIEAMTMVGNASSIHFEGRRARSIVENTRKILADACDVATDRVIFTSGATEAAHLALSPQLLRDGQAVKVSHLYMSAIEHACILSGGQFSPENISTLPVTEGGVVSLNKLEEILSGHNHNLGAPMVAVMIANNETGVLQPIKEISDIVARHNGYLCVDCVQGFMRESIDFPKLNAHFALLSSHKIGGPKGVGALLLLDEHITIPSVIKGGGQENYYRAGTENVAAIAGFAAAIQTGANKHDVFSHVKVLRDEFESALAEISRAIGNNIALPVIFGEAEKRLANTSCFALAGIKAENALIALDLEGIAISSGSACSSGKIAASHVLEAMGVDPELAQCALRVSMGPQTTNKDTGHFLEAWEKIVRRMSV